MNNNNSNENLNIKENENNSIKIKYNEQSQTIEINDKTEVENIPTKKKEIFACYLVIFTHACLRGTKVKFATYEWKVLVSYNSITAYTCWYTNFKSYEKITIKTIFSKYILRMFKAYVFWILCYAVVDPFILKKSSGYLWYLNFTIGLYMATPIFKIIVSDRIVTWYLIIVFYFIEQFMPTATYLLVNYYKIEQFQYLRNFVNTLKFKTCREIWNLYLLKIEISSQRW
ncbi:hypothetical protein H8356DRAFT_1424246 [Neocallimastix lanati (nom. inval.)]|nr:hypothetical protein H8356DRAFT_1424246 [Neocallimastix sp. JGI-2020a]